MSRSPIEKLKVALTRNVAFTTPDAGDEHLGGRTYAVPFEHVWQASLRLVGGGLKRWEVTEADDHEGIIRGLAHGLLERHTSAITVRITLDLNAQTRVDAMAASRVGRGDLGRNARRLELFFRSLDRALTAARGHPVQRVDR